MSRKSALEENGYIYETKEYKDMCDKIYKFEDILNYLINKEVTKSKVKELYASLKELDDLGLNFDVGRINSKILLKFLKTISLNSCTRAIKELLKKCFRNGVELNPLSYGYGTITNEDLADIRYIVNDEKPLRYCGFNVVGEEKNPTWKFVVTDPGLKTSNGSIKAKVKSMITKVLVHGNDFWDLIIYKDMVAFKLPTERKTYIYKKEYWDSRCDKSLTNIQILKL